MTFNTYTILMSLNRFFFVSTDPELTILYNPFSALSLKAMLANEIFSHCLLSIIIHHGLLTRRLDTLDQSYLHYTIHLHVWGGGFLTYRSPTTNPIPQYWEKMDALCILGKEILILFFLTPPVKITKNFSCKTG